MGRHNILGKEQRVNAVQREVVYHTKSALERSALHHALHRVRAIPTLKFQAKYTIIYYNKTV